MEPCSPCSRYCELDRHWSFCPSSLSIRGLLCLSFLSTWPLPVLPLSAFFGQTGKTSKQARTRNAQCAEARGKRLGRNVKDAKPLAWERLKIDTDLLLIIASSASELSERVPTSMTLNVFEIQNSEPLVNCSRFQSATLISRSKVNCAVITCRPNRSSHDAVAPSMSLVKLAQIFSMHSTKRFSARALPRTLLECLRVRLSLSRLTKKTPCPLPPLDWRLHCLNWQYQRVTVPPLLFLQTRSPAIARIADRTGCQWPSRSSKVDDFFNVIWKPICHFLLVTYSYYRVTI